MSVLSNQSGHPNAGTTSIEGGSDGSLRRSKQLVGGAARFAHEHHRLAERATKNVCSVLVESWSTAQIGFRKRCTCARFAHMQVDIGLRTEGCFRLESNRLSAKAQVGGIARPQ